MKTTLLLLILTVSYQLRAQSGFFIPTQSDTLKPIQLELTPSYNRYGKIVRVRYRYDGLDIQHAKDLGKYIMASGDATAMQEFDKYLSGRKAGGWLIATGISTALAGFILQASNRPSADDTFVTRQPVASTPGVIIYGGTNSGYINVEDTQRKNSYYGGMTMGILGALVLGAGMLMKLPGKHVRRAVQYYNKSLQQRGVSWQMTPYSTVSHTGIGLVGRF